MVVGSMAPVEVAAMAGVEFPRRAGTGDKEWFGLGLAAKELSRLYLLETNGPAVHWEHNAFTPLVVPRNLSIGLEHGAVSLIAVPGQRLHCGSHRTDLHAVSFGEWPWFKPQTFSTRSKLVVEYRNRCQTKMCL